MEKEKKRKFKIVPIILSIIMIICIYNIINSIYHILIWKKEGNEIKEELEEIEKIVDIKEIEPTIDDNNNTNEDPIEIEEPKEENPYWAYMKMNLIEVDFYDLKEVNKDQRRQLLKIM